ncbi:MAG: adenylate kinase [Limisphaerales bacterium]
MNIALLGPSGSGKGTHTRELCLRFDMQPLSMGDLLRENLQRSTLLGQIARRYMDAGELVPDEVADGIFDHGWRALSENRNVLLDGFPRRREQAEFFDDILKRDERELDGVIYLHVPENEIVHRLTGRAICVKCHEPYHKTDRPPAKPGVCDLCGGEVKRPFEESAELALKRFRVFQRHVGPVLEYYQHQGKLQIIDAVRPIPVVRDDLILAFDSVLVGAASPATADEVRQVLRTRETAALPKTATLNLLFLGAPGCGKGTQADKVAAEFGLCHVASGDLFRENLKKNTRLGELARAYMNRGELVPDDITEAMVEERLARPDVAEGFILDGFPRTLPQSAALIECLRHLHRALSAAIYIRVPDDVLIERLSGRWICSTCQTPYHAKFHAPKIAGQCDRCEGKLCQREDDKPETVRARLKIFHKQTEPLIERYQREGLLIVIDGQGDIETITAQILSAIRALNARTPKHPSNVALPELSLN